MIEYPYIFDMVQNPDLLQNLFNDASLSKEQLRRLFNSTYETQIPFNNLGNSNSNQLTQRQKYINEVIEAYKRKNEEQKPAVVTCFDNDTLTELLNPEI